MASIFDLIQKIFEILLGILMIVLLFNIFSSVTQSSCVPSEIYAHDELTGFRTGIFDNVYDNVCNTFLTMNSGVWQMNKKYFARQYLSNILNTVSNTIWNSAKPFCKTHTNLDYASSESSDAITDPSILLELILYESERCWNIFEGRSLEGQSLDNRDPLPLQAYFHCAEIIYDFPKDIYLNMSDIFERIEGQNSCGQPSNIPKVFSSNEDSLFWCIPKDLTEDFWFDNFKKVGTYYSGQCIVGDSPSASSDYCFSSQRALCSLDYSYVYESAFNSLAVIEGAGKITISYFDYYDWNKYDKSFNIDSSIVNKACKGSKFNVYSYPRDSLIFCYERYDTPPYACTGSIDCSQFGTTNWGNWLEMTECEYAAACEESFFFIPSTCVLKNNAECSDYTTKAKCLSNNCDFGISGNCVGTLSCSSCKKYLLDTNSPCDRSYACYEHYSGFSSSCDKSSGINSCSDITSEYNCNKAGCAGCEWVPNAI
ncbi:MAG: hypothetical protein WC376_04430 [Candidatus Nanoarchaeia archaeon]|jgi:hypothetical protein